MQQSYSISFWLFSLVFFLNNPFGAFCQPDSVLIKGELTWIHSVPFKYSRKSKEKDNGFIDPEYTSILKKGPRIIPSLITVLTDTTKTSIIDKCTGKYFTMGQLAYILIDNIERIPFALVTGISADVIRGCSYLADGVLYYVRYDGSKFQVQYRAYFYSVRKKNP